MGLLPFEELKELQVSAILITAWAQDWGESIVCIFHLQVCWVSNLNITSRMCMWNHLNHWLKLLRHWGVIKHTVMEQEVMLRRNSFFDLIYRQAMATYAVYVPTALQWIIEMTLLLLVRDNKSSLVPKSSHRLVLDCLQHTKTEGKAWEYLFICLSKSWGCSLVPQFLDNSLYFHACATMLKAKWNFKLQWMPLYWVAS